MSDPWIKEFEHWMRVPPEMAAEMMKAYGGAVDLCEVPAEVGNVRNNKPELMEHVGGLI